MEVADCVYKLTETIIDFMVDHDSLTCMTILQLYNLVSQIQNIITPLLLRTHLNGYQKECLLDVQAVLLSTQRHLHHWNESRSRRFHAILPPRSATRELNENRELLILRHASLMAAVQVATHIKGYNIISPTPSIRQTVENKSVLNLKMKVKLADADQVSLFEADQFWKCHYGDEVSAQVSYLNSGLKFEVL